MLKTINKMIRKLTFALLITYHCLPLNVFALHNNYDASIIPTTASDISKSITEKALVCIICNESGHEKSNCPNKCSVHNDEHLDSNCPRHSVPCSLCNESGHEKSNCPNKCSAHNDEHLDSNCPRHSVPCSLCNESGHEKSDCPNKCSVHNDEHLDSNCPRHSVPCGLCNESGHEKSNCPNKCSIHNDEHLDSNCPRHSVPCSLCNESGHEKSDCPNKCSVHNDEHLDIKCIRHTLITNDNIYVTKYNLFDKFGNEIAKIRSNEIFNMEIIIVDERVNILNFGATESNETLERVSALFEQNSFSIKNINDISIVAQPSVHIVTENGEYDALCYKICINNITYLGKSSTLNFVISYSTDISHIDKYNNLIPLSQKNMSIDIVHAIDNIAALPDIILTSVDYNEPIHIGNKFTVKTIAKNTSKELCLENVSIKINLPEGLTIVNNSPQFFIGDISENGTIEHSFDVIVNKIDENISDIPCKITYYYNVYSNGEYKHLSSEGEFNLTITPDTRFYIESLYSEPNIYFDNIGYVSLTLANKGKHTVYNVSIELRSDSLNARESCYLGNIASASSGTAEISFIPQKIGNTSCEIIVTYENATSEVFQIKEQFSVQILDNIDYSLDLSKPLDSEVSNDEPHLSSNFAFLCIIVFLSLTYILYKKNRIRDILKKYNENN